MGGLLGQLIQPLQRVGVYVPGGAAPLASSLLMSALVAKQAGVEQIIVCTPPSRTHRGATGAPIPHPVTLVAADIAQVDMVFAVGGAQAIGAMAYGTDTIERVDKVCGPGNLFVTLAKKDVYGIVGIDALPGPTETVIVADDSANPEWVAAECWRSLSTPAAPRCSSRRRARLPRRSTGTWSAWWHSCPSPTHPMCESRLPTAAAR